MNISRNSDDSGYVMVGVMVLLALGLIVTAGMLNSSATNAKARALVTTQADYYYDVETTLNSVVSWLQTNSKSLVTGFDSTNFSLNFDPGSPAVGDNEGQFFNVPTMVKMKGTNDSVMLSNHAAFGTSAFPTTTHIDSGASFNAVTEFQNANLGQANARIVLVWARETDGNFEPIFRIDVMTGNNPDRGVHSYSYVYSTLNTANEPLQFYGRDSLTLNSPNNDCYSYAYSYDPGTAQWDEGAPRANCGVGSDSTINISSKVNGTAKSLSDPGVVLSPPGGSVSGSKCEGVSCHPYVLPVMGGFASYCPSHNGDLNVTTNTSLPSGGCWNNVEIANNRTLYLEDTSAPYYFNSVDFKANFARLSFGPGGQIPPGQKVTVYVETVNNNHMNGNQFYNNLNAPHQVEFNYIGTTPFTFNGTAEFNALVTAPNADITVSGNFIYNGGIWAKSLMVNGKARIYGDEAIAGIPVLRDINFALRKTSQRYR